MSAHQDGFRAMDTDVDIIVEAGMRPFDAFMSARLLFEDQEARFSRFRPSSQLSRLNQGETVADARFLRACEFALDAFEATGGLYNPMVLTALRQAGYDRTFREVSGGSPGAQAVPDPRECLVFEGGTVRLAGGELDLGGIVKGWSVDLLVELLAPRYPDLFVNAGGDLRTAGQEPGVDGWLVGVEPPGGGEVLWEGPVRGAVATSTTRKRRWKTATGGFAHHLIDPRTGLPAESPYEQVTVWAPEAWRAETWAKAVLVGGGEGAVACAAAGLPSLAVCYDGTVEGRGLPRVR